METVPKPRSGVLTDEGEGADRPAAGGRCLVSPEASSSPFTPALTDSLKRSSLSIFVCKYSCCSLAMYSAHFTYLCTALRGSDFGGGKEIKKKKKEKTKISKKLKANLGGDQKLAAKQENASLLELDSPGPVPPHGWQQARLLNIPTSLNEPLTKLAATSGGTFLPESSARIRQPCGSVLGGQQKPRIPFPGQRCQSALRSQVQRLSERTLQWLEIKQP